MFSLTQPDNFRIIEKGNNIYQIYFPLNIESTTNGFLYDECNISLVSNSVTEVTEEVNNNYDNYFIAAKTNFDSEMQKRQINILKNQLSASDYKILKVSAVTSKVYKPHESKFAPNTFEPNPLAIVEKGDLLFSRANTTELVAATAYVWETPENIVLPDKLWKFSISDESKVNKLYLWDLFKNIEFRNELSKLSSGTSGSMKNISKGKLNELKMPLPPKELQDKFAEFSTKLWVQIKTFQQSSDSLDSLFNSLQNQAFNGTL